MTTTACSHQIERFVMSDTNTPKDVFIQYVPGDGRGVIEWGYDQRSKTLGVTTEREGTYHYLNVPQHIVDELSAEPRLSGLFGLRVPSVYRRVRPVRNNQSQISPIVTLTKQQIDNLSAFSFNRRYVTIGHCEKGPDGPGLYAMVAGEIVRLT